MVALVLESLAPLMATAEQSPEAQATYRRLIDLRQNLGEADTSAMAGAREGLAAILQRSGHSGEAESLIAHAEGLRLRHGSKHGLAFDSGVGGSRRTDP